MMESYIELIRQDVSYHEDTSSWPSSVSQFVQSLQNELRLPRWLKSGPVPYKNERALDLLEHLRASDDESPNDIWDDTERINDDDFRQRLHTVFSTALVDCARIRAVLETERATGAPYPKASFLGMLVCDVIMNNIPRLFVLDDVLVVLPRHFSGEPIPILKYMTKSFLAPLIISICEKIPIKGYTSGFEHQLSDDEDSNSPDQSIDPLTMSECTLSPQFEAYFDPSRSSATPPSACHIPILCMADEGQLPVLMSSLLYQRRVWHIKDPLVGIEFSHYDTIIKLVVGWLEDNVPSDRVLPQVHLGVIETPGALDLSSPSIALSVSRLLCGLEPRISGIRDTIKQSVDAVVSRTQSQSSLSWRIDTELSQGKDGSDPSRDVVTQWTENQRSESMVPGENVGVGST